MFCLFNCAFFWSVIVYYMRTLTLKSKPDHKYSKGFFGMSSSKTYQISIFFSLFTLVEIHKSHRLWGFFLWFWRYFAKTVAWAAAHKKQTFNWMKNYFVLKSFLLEVQCMLEVSIVTEADKANIQESVKEQQAFVKVSMKSCIICLGWKIAIKIMILSCSEKPITGSKLNNLHTQCCCFPLLS